MTTLKTGTHPQAPGERLSIRGYARHRGITDRAVRKAIERGRIQVGDDGQIDPASADVAWEANAGAQVRTLAPAYPAGTHPMEAGTQPAPAVGEAKRSAARPAPAPAARRAAAPAAEPSDGSTASHQKRKEAALANLRELEYQQAAGNLVDRSAVRRGWFTVCRATRDRLLAIPERIATGLPREVREKLEVELRSVADMMSREVPGLPGVVPSAD